MQTTTFGTKPTFKAIHQASTRLDTLPSSMTATPTSNVGTQPNIAMRPAEQLNAYAELDAMLIQEPSMGAVSGLRAAMLFNAGLALSGMVAWEVWTLVAR